MILDPSSGLWHRPAANDLFIVEEVRGVYDALPVEPGDVLLDLGAHIGATSRLALERGAAKVIAVEPDPANVAVLRRNLEGQAAEVVAAAVGPKAGSIRLHAQPERPYLSSTLAGEPGRTSVRVPVVALSALLATHRPSIVKCDIEFGEYALPELRALPAFVRVLAVEIHVRLDLVFRYVRQTSRELRQRRRAAADLIRAIEAQGFRAVRRRDKQARHGSRIEDSTGLAPMTKSIDAIWARP